VPGSGADQPRHYVTVCARRPLGGGCVDREANMSCDGKAGKTSWRTSACGCATLLLLGAKVIAPKFGFDLDILMFAVGVLAIGQIFGADASAVLHVRQLVDDVTRR
jgi:hypothetical protein